MKTYRLALIGFGNVGQGLAQILRDRGQELGQRYGATFQIVAVCDFLQGSLYDPAGLDPALLLQAVENDGHLRNIEAPQQGWDALETIARSSADVVVEMSYTDLQTGEPAVSHVRAALLGPSLTVPFVDGSLTLGTWQQIIFIDFDNRSRRRRLVAQIIGE